MNYHWNWGIFWEPSPNGTGNYLDMLLSGLVLTIETALCAWIIALAVGTVVGVMRTLPSKTASAIGFCYVEFFRNIPLLVQLFLWFFVLPEIVPRVVLLPTVSKDPEMFAFPLMTRREPESVPTTCNAPSVFSVPVKER